jgi:hypothetical protein
MRARSFPSLCLSGSLLALLALLAPTSPLHPTQAFAERVLRPTPFSLEIPPNTLIAGRPLPALPLWIESISLQTPVRDAANPNRSTVVRIRLRKLSSLIQSVELRVTLRAGTGGPASLSAWTEAGSPVFQSDPFGSPSATLTEVLRIPASGADYLDLTLPGKGDRLAGLFLTALKNGTVLHPIDFPPPTVSEAFQSNTGTAEDPNRDIQLFGRVAAMLESGPFTLEAEAPTAIDFELPKKPAATLLSFEVRNLLVTNPPTLLLNEIPLPPLNAQLPDLADPAWTLRREIGLPESSLQYGGWIKVQLLLPSEALLPGINQLTFQAAEFAGPANIRNVELQIRNFK